MVHIKLCSLCVCLFPFTFVPCTYTPPNDCIALFSADPDVGVLEKMLEYQVANAVQITMITVRSGFRLE